VNRSQEQADRFFGQLMSTVGLDVEYRAAEGDELALVTADGGEVPVLDLIGGFGSLILGHHHPEVVAHVRAFLDQRRPVYAQFARNDDAQRVTELLNTVLRREFGFEDDGYAAVFGNSGAEGVEIALKHAELDRVFRIGALGEQLAGNLAAAGAAVASGDAVLSPAARALAGTPADGEAGAFAALTAVTAEHNAAQLAKPPVFFALEGGFHGKLVGSLGMTHNPLFRGPFQALGPTARFFPVDDPAALRALVDAERASVLDVVVADGVVDVHERPAPVFAGLFLEPIQGEAGIRPVSAEQARALQEVCREIDCPIIVDEIQSGAGRTGTFFASARIGLRGDYYVLSKSLGGGIAKTSVTLVRTSRYRKEFEALHSSTFAKDGFSTSVALKVLELLEADDGRAYRLAAERGAKLFDALERVRKDFPDVIADVRGNGLLLGVEFHDQSAGASALISGKSAAGQLGFVIAGYLLTAHRLRLMPTGSSPNTLRVQPSINVTDAHVDRLETGLRAVCEILGAQDALHLVHPVVAGGRAAPRDDVRRLAPRQRPTDPAERTVSLVAAVSSAEALRLFDPSLADLDDQALEDYLTLLAPARALPPMPPVRCGSVDVVVFPFFASRHDLGADVAGVVGDLAAVLHGARTAGLTAISLDRDLGAVAGAVGLTAFPGLALDVVDADLVAVLTGAAAL